MITVGNHSEHGISGSYYAAEFSMQWYFVPAIPFRPAGWPVQVQMTHLGQTKTATTFIGEGFSLSSMLQGLSLKLYTLYVSDWESIPE